MIRVVMLAVLVMACPAFAETRVPLTRGEISLSFAPLVREATPAVVNIYARRVVQSRTPFSDDPFFGPLLRDLNGPRERVQNSLGSGVILSSDGYVVSNYHVVGQATDIRVVLSDRREYVARVLLGDEEADLAILRIEDTPKDMPYLVLRDSDSVEVGELVLAIGNPFGVGQTVSSGIVSGLARSGTATGNARGYFIQTDAPINPGNSGGALIDMQGRLIGVNTSILTRSGGSNGIGFAIPSALVAQFLRQAQDGRNNFSRPWAGITGQQVDSALAQTFDLDRPAGVVLAELHSASPFRTAGLQAGDVVLRVDGQPVNTPNEMQYRMSVRGIGAVARVDFVRRGTPYWADVKMIAPPDDPPRNETRLDENSILPGLRLVQVNPAVISEYGLPLESDGVVVLDPGPFGLRAGLRAGDILRQINGRPVEQPQQVGDLLLRAAPRIQIEAERGMRRLILRFRT